MQYTRKSPIGVCGAIIPWNFPLLMAAFKLCPLIASGCTGVLKPAELTSLSALRFVELLHEAGLPSGVVNVVPGLGTEAGEALVTHPDVEKIAFTGSTNVGKHIKNIAGIKNVTLELGGKNPLIVTETANLDVASGVAAGAGFINSG